MAKAGKYVEGRFYMAWAALALLLASWAGVAIHDQVQRRHPADGQLSQTSITTSRTTSGFVQPQPQTRTRGS